MHIEVAAEQATSAARSSRSIMAVGAIPAAVALNLV